MKRTFAMLGALLILAVPAMAGEWHTGSNNLCTDCHTMHFSMQHNWDGSTPVGTTGTASGNWLGTTGPNDYLLKAPDNDLCTSCHNGQTFAPDVFQANTNSGSAIQGRMAGALNDVAGPAEGYDAYMGHTIGTTDRPPGYNPDVLEVGADPYPVGSTLTCVSCHLNHGIDAAYRNLGPTSWGLTNPADVRPTYAIQNTEITTVDVWIDLASYTANSGAAGTFSPYYDFQTINYNRNDATSTTGSLIKTSNRLDTFCSACHSDFHGGPEDSTVGPNNTALGSGFERFSRHPTSQATIGATGDSVHSSLSFYTGATTKTKVYTSNHTTFADASPGCVTCHKAHGNQNPFGIFLLSSEAATVTEQGGLAASQSETIAGYGVGYMSLCGQCHTQGINFDEIP